ncbi:MAG TPA: hypothetical protein VLV16_13825 [Gemmatimonadales bacterium]|nr:hypothetical protein [Gemmatimonadales bacterium]
MRRIALTGLLLAGAACTSVRPVQPAEYIPKNNPQTVWVTYTDNSFVPVDNPTIVGDTLKGTWAGLSEPVTIPFSQIQTVQAKMPNHKRTIMLVSVVGLAAAGVAYTVSTAGNSGDPNFKGCGATKGTANTYCCDGISPGDKNTSC